MNITRTAGATVRRPARYVAAALAAGALVAATPALASAETYTHADSRNDVYLIDGSGEVESDPVLVDGKDGVDVRRVRVAHTDARLRVKLKTVGLVEERGAVIVLVKTGRKADPVDVWGRWGGKRGPRINVGYDGPCKGAMLEVLDQAVIVTAPTKCFGDPRRVKVSGGLVKVGNDRIFADDMLSPTLKDDPAWSPWIVAG